MCAWCSEIFIMMCMLLFKELFVSIVIQATLKKWDMSSSLHPANTQLRLYMTAAYPVQPYTEADKFFFLMVHRTECQNMVTASQAQRARCTISDAWHCSYSWWKQHNELLHNDLSATQSNHHFNVLFTHDCTEHMMQTKTASLLFLSYLNMHQGNLIPH